MSNRNHILLKDLVCAKEKYQTVLYAIPTFDIESTDTLYIYAHTEFGMQKAFIQAP